MLFAFLLLRYTPLAFYIDLQYNLNIQNIQKQPKNSKFKNFVALHKCKGGKTTSYKEMTPEQIAARRAYMRDYMKKRQRENPTPKTPEQKQAAAEYQREWRRKNPEKFAAIQARYWAKRIGGEERRSAE